MAKEYFAMKGDLEGVKSQTQNESKTFMNDAINSHNGNDQSHADIRLLISDLKQKLSEIDERLTALENSEQDEGG